MAVYAVGDVHGRLDAFRRLLRDIRFDSTVDQVWLVGDLVNRGQESIEVIEFVRSLGNAAVTVLGNHDLFLLAYAEAKIEARPTDTFPDCLQHPAANRALEWLRKRPLVAMSHRRDAVLVHAGLPHVWRPQYVIARARVIENRLAGNRARYRSTVSLILRSGVISLHDYLRPPWKWRTTEEIAYCMNALVHLRHISWEGCFPIGRATLNALPAHEAPRFRPWYETWEQRHGDRIRSIYFGHWASLRGLQRPPFHGLDTNCGREEQLTAINLANKALHSVGCRY